MNTLAETTSVFPGLYRLVGGRAPTEALPSRCVGLGGRRVRKLVLRAMGSDPELALNLGRVTADRLRGAAEAASLATAQLS